MVEERQQKESFERKVECFLDEFDENLCGAVRDFQPIFHSNFSSIQHLAHFKKALKGEASCERERERFN